MLTAMVEALSASIRGRAGDVVCRRRHPPDRRAQFDRAPARPSVQETTLLASFEQMETRPFRRPEVGTAVIFHA